jgi:hypothetical protein
MSTSGIISTNNGKIFNDLLPNPYPYPAAPPSLAQVLQTDNDAGNQDIENLLQIQVTNVVQQDQIGGHLTIGGTPSNPGSGGTLRIQGGTDLGSILVGDGVDTKELVCPTTSGATATTSTIYNWLSLANGQSKSFLVNDGTLFHQGYSITIVYSGSDSITGTITSVVANLVTLTIVSFTSATYVPTTLISTTPPDPVTATSGGGDPVFIFNPAVSTPTTIAANSFLLTGLCYLYSAPAQPAQNITLTALSIGAVNPTTSAFTIPVYENPPVSTSAFSWGTDGCFLPLGSPDLAAGTGGNIIAFAFPTGGSFIDQDFTGSVSGYSLPYTPDGQITINSKLVLTADSTKPLGVFWGVDAQGVGTITSVSAGNNISVSGSLSAPVVNLQSPLTATLAVGTQNITGSSGNITLSAGGSILNETASAITITNATDNTTFNASGVDTNYFVAGVAGANADLNTNVGNAQLVMSSSDLAGGTSHILSITTPLTIGNVDILHTTIGATKRNMDIATEGSLGISAGVVTIPTATTSNTGITLNAGGLASNTLPVKITNSNAGGQANPTLTLTNTNATGSVALEVYKNKPTAGVNGDVLFNQSVYGKDSGNAKQEFTRITHTIRDTIAGTEDGSIEFSAFRAGAVNTFIQINGVDNEVNVLKNLDMGGNSVITNTGDMTISTTASAGTGQINIFAKADVDITGTSCAVSSVSGANVGAVYLNPGSVELEATNTLTFTGAGLQSNTAGAFSGEYLGITLNGNNYKIALLNL